MSEQTDTLSEREIEILRLVATGAPNKEIAQKLAISPNTVKVHMRNIFAKIGVSTRTEATLYAIQAGLLGAGTRAEALPGEPAADSLPEETPLPIAPFAASTSPGRVEVFDEPPQAAAARPGRAKRLLPSTAPARALAALLLVIVLAGAGLLAARFFAPAPVQTPSPAISGSISSPRRWSVNAMLPAPRRGMAAAEHDGTFFLIGGETAAGITADVLRYDRTADAWLPAAGKPTAVTEVQAALLGEKIYIPGGLTAQGATDVLEVYNPRLNTWETRAPLPKKISGYALVAYEGHLYVFGGHNGGEYSADVLAYDPQANEWQPVAKMTTAAAFLGATTAGDKIYIIGGYDGIQALSKGYAFYPARLGDNSPAWETLSAMPQGRYGMGMANLAGFIYILGGKSSDTAGGPALPNMQYFPQSDQWAVIDPAPEDVGAFLAVIPSGSYLHTLGGETGGGLSGAHQMYQAIFTLTAPNISNESP